MRVPVNFHFFFFAQHAYSVPCYENYLNFLKPIFSGVLVTRSLVLYVCFVDRCLAFCTFPFGRCVVCSSIYGFWLLLYIRIHKSDRIHNDQKKNKNNDLQNTTQKTNDQEPRTPQKPGLSSDALNFLKLVFSRVHVTRSLVLNTCFVDRCPFVFFSLVIV
jgi:uncharacterized membrane protein